MASINLPPEIEGRLRERVDAGEFVSMDEAIHAAVVALLFRPTDDFAPGELDELLREGIEQADRGEMVDGETFFEQMRIESLRRQGRLP